MLETEAREAVIDFIAWCRLNGIHLCDRLVDRGSQWYSPVVDDEVGLLDKYWQAQPWTSESCGE